MTPDRAAAFLRAGPWVVLSLAVVIAGTGIGLLVTGGVLTGGLCLLVAVAAVRAAQLMDINWRLTVMCRALLEENRRLLADDGEGSEEEGRL